MANTFEDLKVGDWVRFTKANQPHEDPNIEYFVGCKHEKAFYLDRKQLEMDGFPCKEHKTSWIQLKEEWDINGVEIVRRGFCVENNMQRIYYKENNLTNMQKLTSLLKRILDKNSQKLYKAGYINETIQLTDKGKGALYAILFDTYKAELVKAAEEEIAENKEK